VRFSKVVLLVFLLDLSVWTQEFRATITGHVADSSGGVIPQCIVQVTNTATNEVAVAKTDRQGTYTLPLLTPGTYRLTAEAAGFKKYIRENIVLNVGDVSGVDIAMEVGQTSESITVTAETPALETENADHGLVVDQKRVTELPLNARNPFMLSILSAGVNFNGNQIYQRPFDNGAIADWSVNGGLDRKNEFLLDGAPNNAQAGGNNIAYVPPVDAVQEFKIQTNSYDAQYGKSAGGIVNVSLKSGSNDFHGTLYEFMRRNAFDANSFQNNAAGKPKAGHFLDQYGGSVGGPIWIPKLYNGRNKSFFFFNYEGYREGTPTPLTLSVPQPEMLTGDFSKLTDASGRRITIYNPFGAVINPNGTVTRQPFVGNIIPSTLLNPIAQKILRAFPAPNTTTPGSAYGVNDLFIAGGTNLDKDDFYNFVAKFDQNFGEKHHVFFRAASNDRTELRNTNGVLGPGWQGPGPLKRLNDAYALDWTGSLRPTLVANARFSVARYVEGSRGDPDIGNAIQTLGFPASLTSQLPVPNNFGQYNFTGFTGLGTNSNFNFTNTVAFASSVNKVAGAHSLKAGVDLRWIQYNVQNQGNTFNLTSNASWTQSQYNRSDALSGNSFASFLLGLPSSGSVDNNTYPSYLDRYFATYLHDDFKVSRKLTLNLGFRWDFIPSAKERYNRLTDGFDPNAINPVNAQINRSLFPNLPTVRGGLLFVPPGQTNGKLDLTGLQPRFGLAYEITDKIVFRGGWGRYMINPNNDNLRSEGFNITSPLVASTDGGRTPVPNLLNDPFPSGILQPPGSQAGLLTQVGQGFSFFDPTFKTPYAELFSAGFQFQLPLQSRLEVSYVGNRAYKLQTARQYNEPDLGLRQQCNILESGNPLYCDQLLPNPFFGLPQFAGTGLGTDASTSRFNLSRPFPEFGQVNQRGRNDGKLWYNALQITYGIRAKAGLNVTFAYTYSKAIEQGGFDADNTTDGNSNGLNGNSSNQAFNDIQRFVPERSLASYDRPNVFKISTVYELPFGRGKTFLAGSGRLVNALVGGWQHTMIFQYSSGRPWNSPDTVMYVRNAEIPIDWNAPVIQAVRPCVAQLNDNGSTTLEPYSQSVPGCNLTNYNFLVLPRYAPRVTPFRDAHIRLDAEPQFDMSVSKSTRLTEKVSFQFRAEAFNVFNRFWMPLQQFTNDPLNAQFGQIIKGSAAQGNANFPRQIQLGFKLVF
jgi:Carboxypeptidase regulatory-like domain